jgi:hypothetical protein
MVVSGVGFPDARPLARAVEPRIPDIAAQR